MSTEHRGQPLTPALLGFGSPDGVWFGWGVSKVMVGFVAKQATVYANRSNRGANLVLGTTKSQQLSNFVTKHEQTTHSHPLETRPGNRCCGTIAIVGNWSKSHISSITCYEIRTMSLLRSVHLDYPQLFSAIRAPDFESGFWKTAATAPPLPWSGNASGS